ncbi:FAD-dependent oxidoreductase [Micromonospora sp. NPDC051543]|uniref:FAD-dependent oxidoreductase n=1 Tax=Micromonospora sp. NPDC051543 TaxID=3364287 RepID=UPI00379BC981
MAGLVGERAVVLGGSMAGLLAARVLSEFYGDVTIVDRDVLVGATGPRRGVPQGFHAHALLARGGREMEGLFPGLTEEMANSGMPMVDMGEMHWYIDGLRVKNAHTGLVAVSMTRPALENMVRNRVAAIPNVTFLERTDIVGLMSSPGRDRIIGARVQAHEAGSEPRDLTANLVIDATGRGSRTPVWLEELGYQRPAEDRVKIGLSYTTCEFDLPARPLENDWSEIPLATPSSPRGAFFGRTKGDRHILSLTAMLGDEPTTDLKGVREFAKSLPIPTVYDAIRDAEPVVGPVLIRFPASVRRRYERLTAFPQGYLVVGDGVCSFNPVYGQGMTVSALEALTLRKHLNSGRAPQARAFFKEISTVIEAPWGIAAGGDLAFPEVEGDRPLMVRVMNRYMAKLMYGMLHDSRITEAFMRVAGLIDPPQSLLKPAMMMRVFRAARRPLPAVPEPSRPAESASELAT